MLMKHLKKEQKLALVDESQDNMNNKILSSMML